MALGTSSGSAGAIRAGRAFVELFAEDSKLQRALARAKARVMSFAAFVAKVGAGMLAGGTAILAPIAALLFKTTAHLDDLKKASDRLGTSPEVFDALSKAASMAGVGTEELESSLSKMQTALSDAAAGGKTTSDAFAELGLNAKTLLDLPVDEQLAAIADGLNNIGNAADKTRIVRTLFGKSGTQMIPLLNSGGAGIRSAMGEFRDPALNEAAKNAERFNDALEMVKIHIKSAAASLVFGFLEFIGPIETVSKYVTGLLRQLREFIRRNAMIVVSVAAVGAALVVGGAAFIAFGLTLAAVATAIGGIGAALVAVKAVVLAVVGFLVTPVGIITVAVAALTAALAYLWSTTEDGQGAIAQLKAGVKEIVGTFSTAIDGIRDAFAAGDLELAGAIAFTALKLEFTKMLAWWQDRWNAFKGFFVDGWHDAIKLIKLAWTDLQEWFNNLFLDITKKLNESFGKSISSMIGALLDAINAIPSRARKLLGLEGLKNDLELFKNAFGQGLFSEELEREKRLNKKEAEDKRRAIEKQAAEEQEARDRARKADKGALEEIIGKLQQNLLNLTEKAAQQRIRGIAQDAIGGGVGGGLILQGIKELNRMAAFSGAGRGVFGGPLAAQLGYGSDVAEKTLEATERAADGIEELPEKLDRQWRLE